MKDKLAKMQSLLAEFDRSRALEQFEPRAFSHGRCRAHLVGNLRFHLREVRLVITLGNGEVIEHLLSAVPDPLKRWMIETANGGPLPTNRWGSTLGSKS